MIKQELKMKHVDITDLEQVLDELTDAGDIDFYENCQLVLAKKRFDLSNFKDKKVKLMLICHQRVTVRMKSKKPWLPLCD
ncbi:hypothetical protein [Photobacterium kishitanii]|uniref:hypothetical protein n=1 Tax=Photobacterium kishitanii TaxID=318456 RepID=UPI00273A4476|nr:hypothetical protein [Photobacterium kishitanii]